jgi:hypothetical protein
MATEDEYEYVPDEGGPSMSFMPGGPMGWIAGKAITVGIGIAVVIILIWLISCIPIAGPPLAAAIRFTLGRLFRLVGLVQW